MKTKHTGRYFTLPNVAFQGKGASQHGWPYNAISFEEAISKAREWGINAFHYYPEGKYKGNMYPFEDITGYEVRELPRQSIAVIMERTSVHG